MSCFVTQARYEVGDQIYTLTLALNDFVSTMSAAGDLEGEFTEAFQQHKTEDSNYDAPSVFNQDLNMDEKPGADDNEPMGTEPDAEMEDLFGDDKPAEEVTHHVDRCVISRQAVSGAFLCEYIDRSAITPVSSEHVDGISSPERKHREAMEYAEDDEPEQIVEEEVLEASAQIPNIPVPRSTDGNVCSLSSTLGQ
jgi:RNA polymerase-associated protein LEO1